MTGRLAAVTGATGFLGQHLVRALSDAGWRVRILARPTIASRPPSSPFWAGLAPEVVRGDLADSAALKTLSENADVVVHAAGLIGGSGRELRAVNVEGTRRLAEAAGRARLIVISSLAAREPQLSAYAASKCAGEDVARSIAGDRVTIARPPAIYGPGDRETLRLFQLASRSQVLPVFDPAARVSVIHVMDAALQIVALAEEGPGGVHALSDARPEGYSWRELMQTAAEAAGRRARLVRLPAFPLYALAALDNSANYWRQRKAVITFGKVRELTHSNWGLQPHERWPAAPAPMFDLPAGFRQTIGWYRAAGWL